MMCCIIIKIRFGDISEHYCVLTNSSLFLCEARKLANSPEDVSSPKPLSLYNAALKPDEKVED